MIDCYYEIRKSITPKSVSDVNGYKDRFDNKFLQFCQKKLRGKKYWKTTTNEPDVKRLINDFIKSEKNKKLLLSVKWLTGIMSILGLIVPQCFESIRKQEVNLFQLKDFSNTWLIGSILLLVIVFMGIAILLWIYVPKTLCTFEGIDIDKIIEQSENNKNACQPDHMG